MYIHIKSYNLFTLPFQWGTITILTKPVDSTTTTTVFNIYTQNLTLNVLVYSYNGEKKLYCT